MADVATIDGSGRLVIPKHLRVRLGLTRGLRLRVSLDGDRLTLEPLAEHSVPVEHDGLLVIEGELEGAIPDHRDLRRERDAHVSEPPSP